MRRRRSDAPGSTPSTLTGPSDRCPKCKAADPGWSAPHVMEFTNQVDLETHLRRNIPYFTDSGTGYGYEEWLKRTLSWWRAQQGSWGSPRRLKARQEASRSNDPRLQLWTMFSEELGRQLDENPDKPENPNDFEQLAAELLSPTASAAVKSVCDAWRKHIDLRVEKAAGTQFGPDTRLEEPIPTETEPLSLREIPEPSEIDYAEEREFWKP